MTEVKVRVIGRKLFSGATENTEKTGLISLLFAN